MEGNVGGLSAHPVTGLTLRMPELSPINNGFPASFSIVLLAFLA